MPRGSPGVPIRLPETQLLSDFLAAYYPSDRVQLQARLGGVNPEDPNIQVSAAELRMLGVWRRYVDAVVFKPDRIILIEANVKPDPGKISILDVYAHLFPLTPEFAEFANLPIEKVAVWAMKDSASELIASRHGVRVVTFTPSWITDYIATLEPRKQRATKLELTAIPS